MSEQTKRRDHMVEQQLIARNITDARVIQAMRKVPRENFIPEKICDLAYEDSPLPIGQEQTISQPYMVAFMTEAAKLTGPERVLEIGTGSGYAAAILAEIADQVYTIERIKPLAETAQKALQDAHYTNVHVINSDGTKGLKEHAPYDAIIVTAGGPKVPGSLRDQLKIGGRLILPVGKRETHQTLLRVTRTDQDTYEEETLCAVRFVPLIGEEGWNDNIETEHNDPGL